MQPSAYRSEAVPVSRPSACSGDQYSGVPTNVPAAVSEPPPRATRASPKSVVTTRADSCSTRMLAGVRSRCTTFFACA